MVRQREMLGLGHAILTGEPLIGDQPFGVVLSDDLCLNRGGSGVLAQMAALYEEFQCSIVAVQEVPMDEVHQYGVVAGTLERDGLTRVTEMVEKPREEEAPSNLAVIGRYILTPDIFDIIRSIPPGPERRSAIDGRAANAGQRGRVLAYQFEGLRFDCGSVPGFVEATQHVFEHYYGQE